MILIKESRSEPLYHGTTISNLQSIMKSNTLNNNKKSYTYGDTTVHGASLTRSYDYAKSWVSSVIILQFDQSKLTNTYKLIPKGATDPGMMSLSSNRIRSQGKCEEYVLGPVTNLSKYVTKVCINKSKARSIYSKLSDEDFNSSLIELYDEISEWNPGVSIEVLP